MRTLLLCLLAVGVQLALSAQQTWIGYLEGVHPVMLVRNADDLTATLTTADRPAAAYELVGSCVTNQCRYRARQAALGVQTQLDDTQTLRLSLTDGEGTARTAHLRLVDTNSGGNRSLPETCSDGGRVRAYQSANQQLDLVLAHLASGSVVGTAFLSSLGTSLRVSGNNLATLSLRDEAGKSLGSLHISERPNEVDAYDAQLSIGGSRSNFHMLQQRELKLGCQSSRGRFDLIYPKVEGAGSAYAKQVASWWDQLLTETPEFSSGSAWFVPARLDARLLSGWLMMQQGAFAKTQAVNIDLQTGRVLKPAALLGPKKQRGERVAEASEQAMQRHPLRQQADFVAWAMTVELTQATALAEGVALSGAYHPVYGQLSYTTPWDQLGYAQKLPAWISEVQDEKTGDQ